MAAKTPEQKAWSVTLSADKKETFTHWLCRQISDAITARSVSPGETEYWWTLYEQGRTRGRASMPWQDAADLTSYIPSEKVDAMRSRIARTIFTEPFYTVEGWGDSAKKAPFVEDFHQWAIESEGLQAPLMRALQASLVETRGVLEVYEDTTTRKVRKKIQALVAPSPLGAPFQLSPDLEPVLAKDQNGEIIEANDQDIAAGAGTAETMVDVEERVRKGPGYRVLPYRDFLVLPSHAKEKPDIWGYAKKFTKRWDLLTEDAERGVYDKKAVERIHDNNEVTSETTLSGNPEPVADQREGLAEKELWEVQLLTNLGEGLRWYVATIHLPTYTLLRLVHEDKSVHRYIIFVPFPRSDKSHEGYSFVGHKLITIAEEHTAWRNMLADRASMEISAPVKRLVGALWDPDLQPFGPKAVIDVRDMKEVEPMQLPPAMNGAINREEMILNASERISGMNDVVTGGTENQGDTTLGELNMRTEMVMVRMDEVIKNLQESLEDLGQVRHAIWLNCVKEYGDAGMPMPMGLQGVPGLDDRGGQVDTSTITPELLEGTFRFKPRGSTETADKAKLRNDYMQGLQALAVLFQTWPMLAQTVAMNPQAAGSAVENWLRLFNIPDKQAWLAPIKALEQQQAQAAAMGMPPMGMMPPGMGMPPGAPPMPGMPQGMPPGWPARGPMPPQPPQGA